MRSWCDGTDDATQAWATRVQTLGLQFPSGISLGELDVKVVEINPLSRAQTQKRARTMHNAQVRTIAAPTL
jgi:hypothetical protein